MKLWRDPASRRAVEATSRKKAVFSGLATEVCAAFPALSARRDGDDVHVAIDACADFDPLIAAITSQRLAAAGAIVATWIAALAGRSANAERKGDIIGALSSRDDGQYGAAMNNVLGVSANAAQIANAIGSTRRPPSRPPTFDRTATPRGGRAASTDVGASRGAAPIGPPGGPPDAHKAPTHGTLTPPARDAFR